eukprot:1126722_1
MYHMALPPAKPTYHTNCATECRSNGFETCGADKASADGLLRASGLGIDPHGIINPKPKHIQPIALKQHGIRMLLWHLVLVVVSTLVINCMYSTIGYSIKTLIHDVVALQKGVKRTNHNQDGISLLMWDFTLLFTVLVLIDWMKQTLNKGVTIKEFDGIQRAECKLSGSTDQPQNEMEPCRAHVDWINERSGPRNHISSDRKDSFKLNNVLQSLYQTALIRVSIPLIAYSLFVAVQRDDYIAPVFEHVSNNTLSIVFHLLISKQKLGQPNKRDKVIMAKLWFEKRKEICCVVTRMGMCASNSMCGDSTLTVSVNPIDDVNMVILYPIEIYFVPIINKIVNCIWSLKQQNIFPEI